MKKLLLALFLIPTLLSCMSKAAKPDLELMQFNIEVHNSNQRTRFLKDSLDEDLKERIRFLNVPDTATKNQYLRVHGRIFSTEWNMPYDIKTDRFLTVAKYLKYCEAHNVDPEKYLEYIN